MAMTEAQVSKLKDLGLRVTPQRLAILSFLDGNTSHPSAMDIYNHLAGVYPSLSLATVYNTLDALARNGMLRELPISKDQLNYDPDTSEHDHAFCVSCGRIFDVFPEGDQGAPSLPPGSPEGASLVSVQRVYYIECKDCREKRG